MELVNRFQLEVLVFSHQFSIYFESSVVSDPNVAILLHDNGSVEPYIESLKEIQCVYHSLLGLLVLEDFFGSGVTEESVLGVLGAKFLPVNKMDGGHMVGEEV